MNTIRNLKRVLAYRGALPFGLSLLLYTAVFTFVGTSVSDGFTGTATLISLALLAVALLSTAVFIHRELARAQAVTQAKRAVAVQKQAASRQRAAIFRIRRRSSIR